VFFLKWTKDGGGEGRVVGSVGFDCLFLFVYFGSFVWTKVGTVTNMTAKLERSRR